MDQVAASRTRPKLSRGGIAAQLSTGVRQSTAPFLQDQTISAFLIFPLFKTVDTKAKGLLR